MRPAAIQVLVVMGKILGLLIGLMLTASSGAAERLGDVPADPLEDAIAAYQRGDFAAALQLFQPLAEHGDASAQCNLGVMYEQGKASPRTIAKR